MSARVRVRARARARVWARARARVRGLLSATSESTESGWPRRRSETSPQLG